VSFNNTRSQGRSSKSHLQSMQRFTDRTSTTIHTSILFRQQCP